MIYLKKYCIILIVFLSFSQTFAQTSKSFQMRWMTKVYPIQIDQKQQYSLFLEGGIYDEMFSYLPVFPVPVENYQSGFQIINPEFTPLSSQEEKLIFNKENINSELSFSNIEKDQNLNYFYINTIRKSNNGYEKLVSFEVDYITRNPILKSRNNNTNFRSASNQSSVLSGGDFYKLGISYTGIFKINKEYLKKIGVNVDAINPKNIKIYGNGGGMLPQLNATSRPKDLIENPIYIEGESDNKFDDNDFIIFYGTGPDTLSFNSVNNLLTNNKNIYSDQSFYFLSIDNGLGKRIVTQDDNFSIGTTLNSFTKVYHYENEKVNLLKAGRDWFGESFLTQKYQEFSFDVSGIVANSNFNIKIQNATKLELDINKFVSFTHSVNNSNLGSVNFNGQGTGSYHIVGQKIETNYIRNTSILGNNNICKIGINFNNNIDINANGYLDYITLQGIFSVINNTNQTIYCNECDNYTGLKYSLTTNNVYNKVWKINSKTNFENINVVQNSNNIDFNILSNFQYKSIVVFDPYNINSEPVFISKINNQNISSSQVPNMVIVTTNELLNAAQILANHRNANGVETLILTTDQIYNEFSSGAQDLTAIRDMARMFYLSDPIKFQNILLFGACSYDYKNRISNNTNFVPIYEAVYSFNPILTYSSDDYLGFMDSNEGNWGEFSSVSTDHTMEIGVGRLPARSIEEAYNMVNKIINYERNRDQLGNWRNKVTFIADIGDNNLHQKDANDISQEVITANPFLNINKIFSDAYPLESTPSGYRSEAVVSAINNQFNNGNLIINYTGHGNEYQLGGLNLVNIQSINNWNNEKNMPFVVTATCEFGRYDDPSILSGGNKIISMASTGGIGLLTTTRPVYSNTNKTLTSNFYKKVFLKPNNQYANLGWIVRNTKNISLAGPVNRNYSLLGDPSMILNYPREKIEVNTINGKPAISFSDTLNALSKVTLEGRILKFDSSTNTNFNGVLQAIIYDKEELISTNGTSYGGQPNSKFQFNIQKNIIFNGQASVKNGIFKINFIIPKDISYKIGTGKISLYAYDNNNILDAKGYNDKVLIGGSNPNALVDNTPPTIKLFINDSTFVNGGITNNSPVLLSSFFDEFGINTAGVGIGHDITAELIKENQKSTNNGTIVLNEFYKATIDDYQKGKVIYPFKNLENGRYTLKVKAWDTQNNSTTSTIEFVVANSEKMSINHVLNYPNPFTTFTNFHFDHNRSGDDLEIMVQVFTVAGRLIKTINHSEFSSNSHLGNITWNGKDDFEDKIGKGVYIYKLSVKSLKDGSKTDKYEKLVLLY